MTSQQEKQAPAAPVQTLTLPDGRTLSYATYGATSPSAPTVLYFHGFPASHAEAAPFHAPALARGIRIVAPDRPGMGGSTFQPGRAIGDWPADALALADRVRAARFAVLGVSGGAPYALACCCRDGSTSERVVGAAVVAGLYPPQLGLAGMLPDARALLWVAPWCTPLVRWALDWGVGAAARDEAQGALEGVLARGMAGRPGPDRRVWEEDEGGFRGALVASMRGALRESAAGAAWEARLFGWAWGFGLEEVRVVGAGRVVMWHGGLDVNSPVAMAEKAAALMGAAAELRVERDEAHASLTVHKVDEVLDTLKAFF